MELNFTNGKATIKQGCKTIAVVFDRAVFYPLNNIKSTYSKEYPYGLQMSVGFRECETLEKVIELIKKYTTV